MEIFEEVRVLAYSDGRFAYDEEDLSSMFVDFSSFWIDVNCFHFVFFSVSGNNQFMGQHIFILCFVCCNHWKLF